MTSSASCFLPQSQQSSTTPSEAFFCQYMYLSSQSIKSEHVAPQVDAYSSMVLCAQCECTWWSRASHIGVLFEIQYSAARCHRSMLKMVLHERVCICRNHNGYWCLSSTLPTVTCLLACRWDPSLFLHIMFQYASMLKSLATTFPTPGTSRA